MMMDWQHLLFVALPVMGMMLIVHIWLKATYSHWSNVPNSLGITGREAAVVILKHAGIHDVSVEQSSGMLSDHYSPRERVLRLSPENFSGRSVAAVGVAAHEAGHAIQHATKFAPLVLRSFTAPLAGIGSSLGYVALMIGVFMAYQTGQAINLFTIIGVFALAVIALFQVITLPVELDASRRALQVLPSLGMLSQEENIGARRVLRAAAFTYIAATLAAIWELVYWLLRLGIIGGRHSDD